MSRVARVITSNILTTAAVVVVLLAGIGFGLYAHHQADGNVQTISNASHQLTQISYNGKKGVTAYVLLTQHAVVTSKKYSFGVFVSAINGVKGDGPKFWTFYVNGKEANEGASSYVTKNSDRITWKLQ